MRGVNRVPHQGQGRDTLLIPPDGAMAGIYARSDIERGVHKAPANEVVCNVLRFNGNINKGVQDVLNPEGINCLRFFEGRGYRVWGARTMSSDPEWNYVRFTCESRHQEGCRFTSACDPKRTS